VLTWATSEDRPSSGSGTFPGFSSSRTTEPPGPLTCMLSDEFRFSRPGTGGRRAPSRHEDVDIVLLDLGLRPSEDPIEGMRSWRRSIGRSHHPFGDILTARPRRSPAWGARHLLEAGRHRGAAVVLHRVLNMLACSGPARAAEAGPFSFEGIIGSSPPMRRSRGDPEGLGDGGVVLITARAAREELVAKAITPEPRREGSSSPSTARDPRHAPREANSSDTRRDFTGAVAQRRGKLEYATRAPFLDEIGDMPPASSRSSSVSRRRSSTASAAEPIPVDTG